MNNGTNGCVEAVGLMGAGTSKFLANEYNRGQFSVPGLVKDAMDNGIPVIPYSDKDMGPGDVAIYGNNDHATLGDGAGGYYGNSSSQNQIVHGGDLKDMGGLMPTKIIKTGAGGSGNGEFTYQAKDANGNPFLNLSAYIRTSNPNEPFDQQSVMSILGQQGPSYAAAHRDDYINGPDYEAMALGQGSYVGNLMMPYSQKLMANRDAELKANIDAQNQQLKLQQAGQLAQLINGSKSVDNRRGYAAMAKMFGINLPDGADQFVNSSDLLASQNAMNEAERNYNLKVKQQQQEAEFQQKQLDLKKYIADRQFAIQEAAAQARASGGGRGGSGKISKSDEKVYNTIEYYKQQLENSKTPDGKYNPDLVEELDNYIAGQLPEHDQSDRDYLNAERTASMFRYMKGNGNEDKAAELYYSMDPAWRAELLPGY